jgi:hypothetical protein
VVWGRGCRSIARGLRLLRSIHQRWGCLVLKIKWDVHPGNLLGSWRSGY